jgi:hypothetical protein
MSNLNYLIVRDLNSTIPMNSVHEKMRPLFEKIVELSKITIRVPVTIGDLSLPVTRALVPVAFNMIHSALKDPEEFNRLSRVANLTGYWFFNVFIVPENSLEVVLPSAVIVTGKTRGIDFLGD